MESNGLSAIIRFLAGLTVSLAPSSLPLLPTLWTDILRSEGVL